MHFVWRNLRLEDINTVGIRDLESNTHFIESEDVTQVILAVAAMPPWVVPIFVVDLMP